MLRRDQGGSPTITIRKNRSEIDIPADIQKSRKVIASCEQDVIGMTTAIATLEERRQHFQKLIGGDNPFSDDSLKVSIESLAVEKRKMEDVRSLQQKRIGHHQGIIRTLELRMLEDDDGLIVQP